MIYKLEREDLYNESKYVINLYEGNSTDATSSESYSDKDDAIENLNKLATEGKDTINLVDIEREYTLVIEETIERVITVKATSIENAIDDLSEQYNSQKIVLDAEDHTNTRIYKL